MSIALTGFDYIVFLTIILSTFIAFIKGFIRTTISFCSWFIGFYAAYFIYPALVPFLSEFIVNKNSATAASCLTSYVLSVVVISLISGKLIDLTKNIRGGLFDRTLGLAFGFLRGCLLVSILFFVIIKISPLLDPGSKDSGKNTPEWLKESYSYSMLNEAMKIISSLIPSDLSNKVNFFQTNDEDDKKNHQTRKLDKVSIKQLLQLVPNDVLKNFDSSTIAKLSSGTMDSKQAKDLMSLITNSYKSYADKQDGADKDANENNIQMLQNYIGEKVLLDNMTDSSINISIPLPDLSNNNDNQQQQNQDGQQDPDSINGNKEFINEQLKKIDDVLGDDDNQ